MKAGGYGDDGRFWDESVIPNAPKVRPMKKRLSSYYQACADYFDACAKSDAKAQIRAEDKIANIGSQIEVWPTLMFAVGLLVGILAAVVLLALSSIARQF